MRRDKGTKKIVLLAAVGLGAYFLLKKNAPEVPTDLPTDLPADNSSGIYEDKAPAINPTGGSILNPQAEFDRLKAVHQTALTYRGELSNRLPQWKTVWYQMTDDELRDARNYMLSFYLTGQKLYRANPPNNPNYPNYPPDGSWNMQLYDAIQAIKNKYHVF